MCGIWQGQAFRRGGGKQTSGVWIHWLGKAVATAPSETEVSGLIAEARHVGCRWPTAGGNTLSDRARHSSDEVWQSWQSDGLARHFWTTLTYRPVKQNARPGGRTKNDSSLMNGYMYPQT